MCTFVHYTNEPEKLGPRRKRLADGAVFYERDRSGNWSGEFAVEQNVNGPRITPEQARIVRRQMAPILQYLGRLQERLKAIGFEEDHKLWQYAYRTYDAAFSLSTQMHFISVGGGFGFDALEKVKPADSQQGEERGELPTDEHR